MAVSSLAVLASQLLAAEVPLLDGYRDLRSHAVSRAEQALAGAVADAQRTQVGHLQLLSEPLPSQFAGVGVISSEAVKLRQGPGGGHPQVGELRAGTPVIIMEWSGYWAQVQVAGGTRGYVFRDYVRTEGSPQNGMAWQS